ncbi:DinB family protein [Chondrinema litorale]|uniref:DinB family protein n=1 Tax=Chondrinema litorale TaxID=2994555 RepID=UPI002543E58F|nr:DinB family protein [Chondrinema litorale]UZR99222.1 DinB family protein [Chondrinema litorale]
MNEIEVLLAQTKSTHHWMDELIYSIPEDKWGVTPENLDTNVLWQVGHLIMSEAYHGVFCIQGFPMDMVQQMPLRDYSNSFSFNEPPVNAVGKFKPEDLKKHLRIIQNKILDVYDTLSLEDMSKPLEPTKVPHPVAKTKFEALSWNVQHNMWHCGQLGILKRMVDERYDFGLRKPE